MNRDHLDFRQGKIMSENTIAENRPGSPLVGAEEGRGLQKDREEPDPGLQKDTDAAGFERLRRVIARLRAPDGCPWDRAQTHESLKPACMEEAAEVVCGINILRDTGNPENLKEELGDLLMQVMIHAQIAEEEGLFTIDDVIRGLTDKMIRRHPHVFGGAKAGGPEAMKKSWEEIKQREKAGKEWMEDYLPEAMLEAKNLIDQARARKGYN